MRLPCPISPKRKAVLPRLEKTVGHDPWKPYLQLENVQHAFCNPHHMRG